MTNTIFEILPEGYFWMPGELLGVSPEDPDYENVCYTFDGGVITTQNFRKHSNLVLKFISSKLSEDKNNTFKEKLCLLLENGLSYKDVEEADALGNIARGPQDMLEKIMRLFPDKYATDLSGIFAEGCRPAIKICLEKNISHKGDIPEDRLCSMGKKVSGALLADFMKMGIGNYIFPANMKLSRKHPFLVGWAQCVSAKIKESMDKGVACKGLKFMSSSWVNKVFTKYPNVAECFTLSLYFESKQLGPCYEIYNKYIREYVCSTWKDKCPTTSTPDMWGKMCTHFLRSARS